MTYGLFGIFFFLLIFRVPIAVALGLSVLSAFWIFGPEPFAFDQPLLISNTQQLFTALDKFPLMAIPFFVLAANIMTAGGLSRRLTDAANAVVGGMFGGLGITTVVSCMFFAAISGSSPATVVAIGSIMSPSMIRNGYGKRYSTGLVASAGSLGILIPPSIPLIVYGVATEESVGQLFMAGFLPGILVGSILLVVVYIVARRAGFRSDVEMTWGEKAASIGRATWSLVLPVIVLGGIYGGFFTPTEAAAVAVVYAFLVAVFVYRDLSLKDLPQVLVNSASMSAMIMFIIANAMMFAFLLTTERIPVHIADWIIAQDLAPWLFLIAVNILLLVVGMFMEPSAAILILAPLLLPAALDLGVDPIHLGIIMVMNLEVGMITPPMGLNLFVAAGISRLPMGEVIRGVLPFSAVLLASLFLVTYVPQISLFLVDLLK